jgi:hypothetical protein
MSFKFIANKFIKQLEKSVIFNMLLAFSSGSLIADVFMHLIPEAYGTVSNYLLVVFKLLQFLYEDFKL